MQPLSLYSSVDDIQQNLTHMNYQADGVMVAAFLVVSFLQQRNKDCSTPVIVPVISLPYYLAESPDQIDSSSLPDLYKSSNNLFLEGWWLHENVISMVVFELVCLSCKYLCSNLPTWPLSLLLPSEHYL